MTVVVLWQYEPCLSSVFTFVMLRMIRLEEHGVQQFLLHTFELFLYEAI
jgi:hypothetical protein